jgi:DNA-binding transcriptional MerR regulator
VENVLRIKKLLYEEGFTIAGARQYLRAETRKKQSSLPFSPAPDITQIKEVRQGLKDILGMLTTRK